MGVLDPPCVTDKNSRGGTLSLTGPSDDRTLSVESEFANAAHDAGLIRQAGMDAQREGWGPGSSPPYTATDALCRRGQGDVRPERDIPSLRFSPSHEYPLTEIRPARAEAYARFAAWSWHDGSPQSCFADRHNDDACVALSARSRDFLTFGTNGRDVTGGCP